MPRQSMTLEQVERSIHRIRSLFPSGSRIVEFGISPLTKRLSEHYEITIIERGRVARRWDIDPNLIISTPVKENNNAKWFWFPDESRLPKHVELIILHDVDKNITPSSFLQHDFLIGMSPDILIVSNRYDEAEDITSDFQESLDCSKKKLLEEPDLTITHLSKNIELSRTLKIKRIDLLTRIYYAAGLRKKAAERVTKLSKLMPSDIRYQELSARLTASPGTWEEASHHYEEIYEKAPGYKDVAWQTIRSSIYSNRWQIVGRILSRDHELREDKRIRKMIEKKFSLIGVEASNIAIEKMISHHYNPDWLVEKWVNCQSKRNQDMDSPVSKIALERYHGIHIGNEVMRRINFGEIKEANNLIFSCTNQHGVIATLESICIDENLPVYLNDTIREILSNCDSETIHKAIQAIGRRGDPSQFLGKSSIMMMIENGTTLYSWMLEFALRSGDKSLLNSLIIKGLPGTVKAIIDTLDNLVANRRDNRVTDLIEVISDSRTLFANQDLRRSICKSLLLIADSIVTHSFAMESIRLEPQDAVCGFIALEAAIAIADPEIILSTADIVLCMRNRSSHIDYASIAIAAIRENMVDYAKDLLTRNRLKMDLRAQRIRIGLPFHVENDWVETLYQIEQTPAKFRDDPTIKIYEAKALSSLMHHESAEEVANSINDITERSILLYSLRQSWGDLEGALECWNYALAECNLSEMPLDWGDSGFNYLALNSEFAPTVNFSEPLVSVIMTIHKWNDAFPLAISSILNQSHSNVELIVVDDCSPEKNLQLYDSLLKDSRIIRIRMDENVGTYSCRNKGLDIAKGKFVTFADSDDWNHPDRIEKAIKCMEELGLDLSLGRYVRIDEAGEVQFNGGRLSRFALMGMMIRRSILVEHKFRFDGRARTSADSELFERLRIILGPDRILRHSGIEIVALHHNESLTGGGKQAIDWTGPGKKRLSYVAGYTNFHKKIMRDENRQFNNLEFQPPTDSILGENPTEIQERIRNSLNIQDAPKKHVNSHPTIEKNQSIYVFMATYSGGYNTVGDAIRSLLSQSVDLTKIILHVNGDSRPPKLPKDQRLKVIISSENLADNGKFHHMKKFNGYFFTVDDDIEYPHDYIERLILEIERYNRKAIVGVHGACLPYGPNLTRWSQYKELRRSHLFQQEHASRIQVDILGTGTTAFHSSINPPEASNMDTIKMVDLHLATWATKQNIPMYLVPRKRNWLTEFEDVGDDRIWSITQENRDLQNDMLSVIGRNPQWTRSTESLFSINNGPLSMTSEWFNRELPPGMLLPPLQSWPPLSDNPLVTIYVPAYNGEEYIEECINSALNQTYNRIEICIHDDGSTDKTLKLLNQKFSGIKNITISSASNQGIGGASNQAILSGKGELILQLDSDDYIEPETVEILVNAIGSNHVCAYGRFRRITNEGDFIDDGWEEPVFSRERLLRSMIVHPPRLFRRDAWEFVGGHNVEITNAVDYDFYTRLSEVGTMTHVRKILYSYRMQSLSTSHVNNEIQTNNTYGVVRRSLERQGLKDFDIHVPNPKYPRRFSIIDRRFTSPMTEK